MTIPLAKREVTTVEPDKTTTETIGTIGAIEPYTSSPMAGIVTKGLDFVAMITKANAAAGLTNAVAETQFQLNELTQQYRLNNSAEPKGNYSKFTKDRQKLFDNMGKGVSSLVRRDWLKQVGNLTRNNESDNNAWALKQTQDNTIFSINNSIEINRNTAYLDGQAFATGAKTDFNMMQSYQQSYENLYKTGVEALGEANTKKLLKDYESDYMKSFVSGVMQQSPLQASVFLERPDIQKSINDFKIVEKLKKSADNKIFNIAQAKTQNEVLGLMKTENNIFARALEENIPIAELEQAFSTNNVSPAAQSLLMKMNGYKKTKITETELSKSEKMKNGIELADAIATFLGRSDDKTAIDFKTFNNKIYKAMDNGSLTKKDAIDLQQNLIKPWIEKLEKELDTFNFLGFGTNLGFEKVEDYYEENIEIDTWGMETEADTLTNNRNKINFYHEYYEALSKEAKARQIPLSDLSDLPDNQNIFHQAFNDAKKKFNERQYNLPNVEGTPTKILSDSRGLVSAGGIGDLKGKAVALKGVDYSLASKIVDDIEYYAVKYDDGRIVNIPKQQYISMGGK